MRVDILLADQRVAEDLRIARDLNDEHARQQARKANRVDGRAKRQATLRPPFEPVPPERDQRRIAQIFRCNPVRALLDAPIFLQGRHCETPNSFSR
jgi:hypothetical protein